MDLVKEIMVRQSEMELIRSYYEPLWSDETTLMNQRRDDILQVDTKGRKRGTECWCGIGNRALNIWVDGIQGFLASQTLVWARAMIPMFRGVDEVNAYLQNYDAAMLDAFRRSNFYSTFGDILRDGGSIGTATNFIEEDLVNKRSVHTAIHPGQIFISENQFGQVDTVHRKFKLTARQALKKFGKEKLSRGLLDAADKQPNQEFDFLHAVYPNNERVIGHLGSSNKKFRSIYIQVSSNPNQYSESAQDDGNRTRLVRDSGYDFMPYCVWRFRKNSDEIYGYSPAADAIIEMEASNALNKTKIQAAQMSVEPPYNVPEEMRGHTRILPKGMNYYKDPRRIVTPLVTGINYPVGIEEAERLQFLIEDKFRVKFFLLLEGAEREMTATEIIERQSEQASLMGPQVDRLINEMLSPIYNLVSEIESRAGRLPEPPPILEDLEELDVEFIGPLAQAQKRLFESQPIVNTMNAIAPLIAMKPEVLDKFDLDGSAEDVAEAFAFPQKRILSDAAVAQIRQQRASAQQAQQQQAMMLEAAKVAPKLGKTIEPNSMLDIMAGV
jgi:hypothetical protein